MSRSRKSLGISLVSLLMSSFALASVSMKGSGSTFIYPVLTKWVDAYGKVNPDTHITYQSVGSLQGVDGLLTHASDFAASDAPLHLEQMNQPSCGTLYFPAVLGAVVVIYNLPETGQTNRIRLTGQVLSDIYLGKIRHWNDPAIAALNPTAALPNQPIIVVYRRDGSGTTYTFTDFLTKADSNWAKSVGAGMVAQWPIGLAADGNEGLAEAVKIQSGAIGYVELSYAISKDVPYALLRNRAGEWIDANPETITAAAASLVDQMPTDLQQSLANAPGPSAYPISSYSYLLFFKRQNDSAKADAFHKFIEWVLHDGQSYAASQHYAPLPEKVAARAELQAQQIEVGSGAEVASASCKASLGLPKHNPNPINLGVDSDVAGSLSSD